MEHGWPSSGNATWFACSCPSSLRCIIKIENTRQYDSDVKGEEREYDDIQHKTNDQIRLGRSERNLSIRHRDW